MLEPHGLVICVRDIKPSTQNYISSAAGDGAVITRAAFRLIVFRPVINELLVATIRQSDASGVLGLLRWSRWDVACSCGIICI